MPEPVRLVQETDTSIGSLAITKDTPDRSGEVCKVRLSINPTGLVYIGHDMRATEENQGHIEGHIWHAMNWSNQIIILRRARDNCDVLKFLKTPKDRRVNLRGVKRQDAIRISNGVPFGATQGIIRHSYCNGLVECWPK